MTTLVLIPGLASDACVWAEVARSSLLMVHDADVTRDASIADMAARLLDETKGDLIVVGHSMGGRVAMEMARQGASRVSGLVLANTGHQARRDGEEIKRQQMIDLGNEDMAKLAAAWLPPMLDPARLQDAELIGCLTEMVLRAGPQIHERQLRALLGRPNASDYLPQVTCPILLLVGRQDAWSPIAQHQEIAALVPDAELVIIEHAGHFAPLERPKEVAAVINEWIDRRFGDAHV